MKVAIVGGTGAFGRALAKRLGVPLTYVTFEAAGKSFRIDSYAGCGHAFLNHTRPDAYRPQAAADAFERAVRFFEAHLSART